MADKIFVKLRQHWWLTPVNLFVFTVLLAAFMPLLIHGRDSIMTVHDNMDEFIACFQMLRENHLLLALDAPTPCLNGMSTLYYGYVSYNLPSLLHLFFDAFEAHLITYFLKLIIGFFSMKLLLDHLFAGKDCGGLCKIVALAFALLPSIPVWWIAVDCVPFLIFVYFKMAGCEKFDWCSLLLCFYPFFTNLPSVAIFLYGAWFLGMLWNWIRKKKFNWNLFAGLCALGIGSLLVELKLVYSMLAGEPTIRTIFNTANAPFHFNKVWSVMKNTSYHGPSAAEGIMLPVVLIGLAVMLLNVLERCGIFKHRTNGLVLGNPASAAEGGYQPWRVAAISLAAIFLCSLLGVLYSAYGVAVGEVFPMLQGFNWGRFQFLNRTLWPIAFTAVLTVLAKISPVRFAAPVLALLQVVAAFTFTAPDIQQDYNYSYLNLQYDQNIKKDNLVTFRQFYDEELFNEIKQDLNYQGEPVAAFGYHPAVLMYNGFSTLDGYMNMGTLQYHDEFRTIIAPFFEKDGRFKSYYDNWGGRYYLFCRARMYDPPTKNKDLKPVDMDINPQAFRNLGGRYILSRGEIANSSDMSFSLFGIYDRPDSIYTIYVYEME